MNLNHSNHSNGLVTTALLLAAGKGSRLYPLTQNTPKCLTMVHEVSILERLVINLSQQGFKRLVVVTGYREKSIREFLGTQACGMKIDYIFSPLYATTNNIYSLWMAREIINEPFMLIESDLVFDVSLLDDMRNPDRIAVARMQPWMNGSTVTIDQAQHVKKFQNGIAGTFDDIRYKTVNIYSFSLSSWHSIIERLDQYISAGIVNDYYEIVFAEMVTEGSLSLKIVSFDNKPWYEIDTIEDLAKAKKLFPGDEYDTTNLSNVPRHASGILKPIFKHTMSMGREKITHPLSRLKSLPKSNSLSVSASVSSKQIHEGNIPENEVSIKNKSRGKIHGTVQL
ncbi:MAG TPA: phosphocholine cytidylyltransferase family protein [Methanosarcinaceae archaeon]|nr:phosphocholine cytidylyltransferase family protein [Methanosarcinaceae archaeon]